METNSNRLITKGIWQDYVKKLGLGMTIMSLV